LLLETSTTSRWRGFSLSLVVTVCWFVGGALRAEPPVEAVLALTGDDAKKSAQQRLVGWGRLGGARGKTGFHEFTLYRKDKRGKPKPVQVLMQIPADVELLLDRQARPEELKEGEVLLVFGRPKEYDVDNSKAPGGARRGPRTGKDRQIQNTRIILTGTPLAVNETYKDSRDKELQWCQGAVSADGKKGVWIDYEGHKHRVLLAKGAPLLRRRKPSEKVARKLLKKGVYFWVEAEQTDADPGKKRKGDGAAYTARKLVALDRRFLRTAYLPVLK